MQPTLMDHVIEKGHLRHEIKMLACCFHRLRLIDHSDSVLRNALFESFCVHARNLFEFFEAQPGKGGARRYAPNYSLEPNTYQRETTRLSNQITHMLKHRTSDEDELLDQYDLFDMLQKLDRELKRFKTHLAVGSRDSVPDLSSFVVRPQGARYTTIADTQSYTVTVGVTGTLELDQSHSLRIAPANQR